MSTSRKKVVVVGGGIGGLAAAALLSRAGQEVTLLEANYYLGGKSRRIELEGQRIDTGPAIFTFPGVWEELLRCWDKIGGETNGGSARGIAGLKLERLPQVGKYYYRGEVSSLPVEE
jgi:phytoene desaturase